MNILKEIVKNILIAMIGARQLRISLTWINRAKNHVKRSIGSYFVKIGTFNPIFSYFASKLNQQNFQEFIDYKDNFENFIASTNTMESLFQADKAFYVQKLKEEAQALNRPDIVKTLDEYAH